MSDSPGDPTPSAKLPWTCHLAAGWPLIMVMVGGAIGGACGGAAYAASLSLFKKRGVNPTSYLLAVLIGLGGIVLYVLLIAALAFAFPNLFKRS